MTADRTRELAALLVARAVSAGHTLAVAESLTGGLVTAALVAVPGTSKVLHGSVVSYATGLKRDLLGVDARLLAEAGPVDPRVAELMAERVREVAAVDGVAADLGLATTGVAGPDAQGGHPIGEVHVAVATAAETRVESFLFDGDRAAIQAQSVEAVLRLALALLSE